MENIQEQVETGAAAPSLTLADITLALQIIQVAAQRNAFKPEEFEEIGGCYNRVLGFLEASGAVQRTQPAEETAVAPEASVAKAAAKPAATKKAAASKPAAKSKGKK